MVRLASLWITLDELRPGALFLTMDGIRAVKSEYLYTDGDPQCVLLDSGEYAHFEAGGSTLVKEIYLDVVS